MFQHVPLNKVINDEQMLELVLETIVDRTEDELEEGVGKTASMILIAYIINNWWKEGKQEFTEDEIDEEYRKLIADYCLTDMANKGLVDVICEEDGEFRYKVSEKGRREIEHHRKM